MFFLVFLVFVCIAVLAFLSSKTLQETSESQLLRMEKELQKSVIQSMQQSGEIAGEKVGTLLKESFSPALTLAKIFSSTASPNNPLDRNEVSILTKSALQSTPSLSAIYTQFEANGYDQQDSDFANTNANQHSSSVGTLEVYWIRENGKAVYYPTEDPQEKYRDKLNEYGVREAEWYLCSMETLKPCALDPYLYEIEPGRKELLTTLAAPIIVSGKFKGLVGVDLNLPVVQKWIKDQSALLFNGKSMMTLLSQRNLVVASTQYPTQLGKSALQVDKQLDELSKTKSNVILNDDTWHVKIPLHIANADVSWLLLVSIPKSVALASVNHMRQISEQEYQSALTELFLYAVLLLIVAVVLAIWLAKSISSPIEKVSLIIQNLSSQEGDLTQSVNIDSHKELISLAAGLNIFIGKLAEMISKSKGYSEKLVSEFSQLGESALNVQSATGEQQSNLDNIVAAMTEMSTTAIEVSRLATDTATGANEANNLLTNTQAILKQNVDEVNVLAQTIETTSAQVSQVSQRSQDITSIVATIQSIAEQTNLLALNAAIEAARAGEQGRGFAVVADEVRNLAARTQSSTQEISELIQNLHVDVTKAVSTLDEIQHSTAGTVEKTNASYDQLTEILTSISMINDSAEQVATAAEEQSQVSEDINIRVVAVSDNSNDLAELGNGLTAMSIESQDLIEKMDEQLNRLKS